MFHEKMSYLGLSGGKDLWTYLSCTQKLEVLGCLSSNSRSFIKDLPSMQIFFFFFFPWLSYSAGSGACIFQLARSYLCFLLAGSGIFLCQGMSGLSAQSQLLPENRSIRWATPRNCDLQKKDCWLNLFLSPSGLSTATSLPFLVPALIRKAQSNFYPEAMKPN